jgi:branched-chain amino acid transport system ATP-binding protein
MSLLSVSGLTGGYGPVRVLHDLAFEVEAGEVVVILGANGSGKTTTLRALSGLISASGIATLDRVPLLGKRSDQIARLGVAHVPQGRGTIPELTVEENLRIGAHHQPAPAVADGIATWCGVFPRLGERLDQLAGNMSGGEQQMLAVARALMSNPKLLLLDEPSLGLAPMVTDELFDRLRQINENTGAAMLIVEQNAALALQLASRGYVLESGRIVADGTAEELSVDDAVRKAYLGY